MYLYFKFFIHIPTTTNFGQKNYSKLNIINIINPLLKKNAECTTCNIVYFYRVCVLRRVEKGSELH